MAAMKKYTSVKEYLGDFDAETQKKLAQLIETIEDVIPEADRTFAYGIPTYKVSGKTVVHFAAYKTHVGLYPGPKAIKTHKDQLGDYKTSKGTIQFPLAKPLPLKLIKEIVSEAARINTKS